LILGSSKFSGQLVDIATAGTLPVHLTSRRSSSDMVWGSGNLSYEFRLDSLDWPVNFPVFNAGYFRSIFMRAVSHGEKILTITCTVKR
jgi:hypothetical protein